MSLAPLRNAANSPITANESELKQREHRSRVDSNEETLLSQQMGGEKLHIGSVWTETDLHSCWTSKHWEFDA